MAGGADRGCPDGPAARRHALSEGAHRDRLLSAADIVDAGGGNRYAPIATPRTGARELVLVRGLKHPRAFSVASRHDREELIWVLAGRARAVVGEDERLIAPGDLLEDGRSARPG